MQRVKEELRAYRGMLGESLKRALMSGGRAAERRGVYSSALVVWLMIFQRLNPDHSLEAALAELRSGSLDDLLAEGSLPARVGRISGSTGGFARARERIPLEVVEQTADGVSVALEGHHARSTYMGFHVYVIDGSALRVPYTPENVEAYPQFRTQYGKAHYPLLRVGVATNAVTGVVARPAYGPFNGAKAVGEMVLAEELFERIQKGSVVIGDRFFGCCRFADMARRAGLRVVTRVKDAVAKKFIGSAPGASGEVAVTWSSVRSRTGNFYSAEGRFIWHTIHRDGFRPLRIVLFTTMDVPRQKVVELYGLRWNVESDLRDIKSTLKMDMLYSRTPAMGAKELILGITAYNFVRHLMTAAARRLNVAPRELSFSRVLKRVYAAGSAMVSSSEPAHAVRALSALLSDLKSLKLPARKNKRPNEPRKRWQRGQGSFITQSRESERAILNPCRSKPLAVQ